MGKCPKLPKGYYWKGYKIKLYPTEDQKKLIDTYIEQSMFVYNWTVGKQKEHYKKYQQGLVKKSKCKIYDLDNGISNYKKTHKWLILPICACRMQIRHYYEALNKYIGNKNLPKPNFKKKKNTKIGSYSLRNDRMYFIDGYFRTEGFEYGDKIRTNWCPDWKDDEIIKFYRPTISRDSIGNYYISFSAQRPKIRQAIVFDNLIIGVDINVKDRFVLSNGYRSGCPDISRLNHRKTIKQRRYNKDLRRMKEWEKANPRKTYEQSKREKKREYEYKNILKKIANKVETFIQTETRKIVNLHPQLVVIEDIAVKECLQSRHNIAKTIYHANFRRCREILENKCFKFDIPILVADRYYPSSQICSNCGNRHKITKRDKNRLFICPHCGFEIDRDLNAAINLKNYAYI